LAIFPVNAEQETEAIARAQEGLSDPVVTTIEPLKEWYAAGGYHQDYWEGAGQRNGYCMAVIPPKLQKVRKSFAHRLKS